MSEFHQLRALKGTGETFDFEQLQGKVVLIVNVASRCGYTPQYKDLERLYQTYSSQGLEIIGFPCNQFGNQEPATYQEIINFTREKFGITFPIFAKINVNGPEEDPVYHYLKSMKQNSLGFKGIRWNFEKFLIDRKGNVVERYNSATIPNNIEPKIKELLS